MDSTSQVGESSKPSTSARDERREIDGDRRRDDGRDKYNSSSSRRRDDGDRRERDRDDYRRRDDDGDRRRPDRGDDDRDRKRERRASPSGRETDRESVREEPLREQRDDRRSDYRERDRNGSDSRRRERDGDSRRDSRRDYDDDRRDRRRRSSRSPPASGSRREDEQRNNSRRDTREDGPSTSTNTSAHGLPPLQTDEPTSQQEVKQFVPPTKDSIMAQRAKAAEAAPKRAVRLIEVIANDRLGGKVRVKCSPKDTVGDLKKLIAVQKGTKPEKIVLKKWYTIYKDHIALEDYEIHDGMSLEMS